MSLSGIGGKKFFQHSLTILGLLFVFLSSQSFAQVCFYLPPGSSPEFQVSEIWTSQYVDARETTLIGDVDGDGKTEVMYDNYANPGTIYQVDGATGVTEEQIVTGVGLNQNNSSNALADVDSDGTAEYFFVDRDRRLHRRDYISSNAVGSKREQTRVSVDLVQNRLYTPSLIDFDGDGFPEIYMSTQIFDVNGNLIDHDTTFNMGDLGGSVAADFLPPNYMFTDGPLAGQVCTTCDGLELAVGGRLYTVDISAGTNALLHVNDDETDDIDTQRTERGATSIADMDNDGDLDIVYTTYFPYRQLNNRRGYPHVVVRDGQTDDILMLYQLGDNIDPDDGVEKNVGHLEGRANIADFDGDGCNEMGIVTFQKYSVVDDVFADDAGCPGNTTGSNIQTGGEDLWFITTTDTSGMTSSSVFDFDGDGKAEVVYRDEDYLLILEGDGGSINGSSADLYDSARNLNVIPGLIKLSEFCGSGTRYENPVVVDVNDDGATEIVVACATNARAPVGYVRGVKVFSSTSYQWAPSRSVRNQHGYHVTNVRNDLTIPAVPLSNSSVDLFDNYLTQSEPLDYNFQPLGGGVLPGGYEYAADGSIDIVGVDTSDCGNTLTVSTIVTNTGDANFTAVTPVTFYDGDPSLTAANILHSDVLGVTVGTGASVSLDFVLPVCYSELFVVLNAPSTLQPQYSLVGTGAGTIYAQTSVGECSYENNISSISFEYCGDGMTSLGEECDDGNAIANDGCSIQCEIEYCRDDAPLYDTSKNFVIDALDPTQISGTSSQPYSQVAICLEDTSGTRDVFYTMTDAGGSFTFLPNFTPYLPNRVNIGIMLHDENGLDIDHHALVIVK